MNDLEDLRATLASIPGWDSLNAYEMTKRCCAELTRRGQRLPSWMNMRDIIGKGSANDINRGKDDFRREHGDALRQMSGFVKGVPEALAPHILGFWTAAISLVRTEFDGQVAEWQAQVERAEAAASHAGVVRDQAVNHAEALQGQITGLQEAMHTLKARADTERAAREQAERMFEANYQDLAGQRDELRVELSNSQRKLADAITRLEGVEKHALMEIERVRSEAKHHVEEMEAKAQRESDNQMLEITRANTQILEQKTRIAALLQEKSLQDQGITNLRELLQRAEERSKYLELENSQLTSALRNAVHIQRGLKRLSRRPALRPAPATAENTGDA